MATEKRDPQSMRWLRAGAAVVVSGLLLAVVIWLGMRASKLLDEPVTRPPLPVAEVPSTKVLPPVQSSEPTMLTSTPVLTPLLSASGTAPVAAEGKAVVEIRTDPPGTEVVIGKRSVGQTPLYLEIAAKSEGACQGGVCSGGTCTGGQCTGGMCVGGQCKDGLCQGSVCQGGLCAGGTCSGGVCEGAKCPQGFRCAGQQCTGQRCLGGLCASAPCAEAPCTMGVCFPTSCTSTCESRSCMGGTCSGGVCESETVVTLRTPDKRERELSIVPSMGPVVEYRF